MISRMRSIKTQGLPIRAIDIILAGPRIDAIVANSIVGQVRLRGSEVARPAAVLIDWGAVESVNKDALGSFLLLSMLLDSAGFIVVSYSCNQTVRKGLLKKEVLMLFAETLSDAESLVREFIDTTAPGYGDAEPQEIERTEFEEPGVWSVTSNAILELLNRDTKADPM